MYLRVADGSWPLTTKNEIFSGHKLKSCSLYDLDILEFYPFYKKKKKILMP